MQKKRAEISVKRKNFFPNIILWNVFQTTLKSHKKILSKKKVMKF